MPRCKLTDKQKTFIKNNYLLMTGRQMAILFKVDRQIVNRYKRKHGLTTPRSIIINSTSKINKSKTLVNPQETKPVKVEANIIFTNPLKISFHSKPSTFFTKSQERPTN